MNSNVNSRSIVQLLALMFTLALTPSAHAYSSFADYLIPIEEGGGGGRWFTGAPSDAYGCEMCHEGAAGAQLSIEGLPDDGYEPGAAYEVVLRWDANAPHVALIAELSDPTGAPAGSVALAPYATFQPDELCERGGFPAADICRLDALEGACCREVDPQRDACSFPNERSALWVPDCGSRAARLVWTAPSDENVDVWFSVGMVTSNLQNDALGDGVTSARRVIRARGRSKSLDTATGRCSLAPSASGTRPIGNVEIWLLIGWLSLWTLRRRAGQHG